MTDHPDDFTMEWVTRSGDQVTTGRIVQGRITDVRITRGKALYQLPWWNRLLPWRWFRFYRKPTTPFPTDD